MLGIAPRQTTLTGTVFERNAESKDITRESAVTAEVVLVTPGRVNLIFRHIL